MSKSKVRMPKELEKKCHIAIHTATTAAAAASRCNTDTNVGCDTNYGGSNCDDYIIGKDF